jgi:rifampicin phosphotransferase
VTTDPTPAGPVGLDQPDFPIEFADPAHVELTWEWDDMHMPHAFTPLAGDFAAGLAWAFQEPYRKYSGGEFGVFPQQWHAAVWHGYVYYAIQRNVSQEQRLELWDRVMALCRSRIPVTWAYWRDELLPELRDLYGQMEAVPVETAPLATVADGWDAAWDGQRRAWDIHFDVILGPYQVMDDLVDAYDAATPGASPGEAVRLTAGGRHELFDVEVETERLAAMVTAEPALADALSAGVRSVEELGRLPGGGRFAAELEGFLTQHGHLGQSVDDLALASWAEEPANFLAELAKRLERAPEPAETRRARLEREAEDLAAGVRMRLADKPDELEKFEAILRAAREIGFMTETHNYWIDRKAQARTRALAMRVGRRLVAEGLVARADDVFYFHHDEISDVLRHPADQRALIASRRADLEKYRTITPPKLVGKPPPPPVAVDRFDAAKIESTEADVLRGTGSSAGIYRGPARVVLTSAEFDRIQPGDIIVCPSSNPSWVPVFTIAGGLVTNTGGVLSHAAVVAREFGLPAVTGIAGATSTIRDGQMLEIDGTAGTVRLL